MAEKLRTMVQRLKGATSRTLSDSQREKVERLVSAAGRASYKLLQIEEINNQERIRYMKKFIENMTTNVSELAERLRSESIGRRVRDIVARYEKFTGVQEVMMLQNSVVAAQERFMSAQEKRRELGHEVASIESRLKELHAEMQNTMKGDDKYLHLCTEEHKLILRERALRQQFSEAEREERERFAEMSSAVKVGHERERAHAERNKYWYIVASILGTVLGIAGSTLNNHLKMAEFREMMERQMAHSAGVLYTAAGGGGGAGGAGGASDIAAVMRSEFAYQEQLASSIKTMQEMVTALVNKQATLVEHLNHHERSIDVQLQELKRLVVTASKASSSSDAELARALAVVHHDLDEGHAEPVDELPRNRLVLEPRQLLTGVGVVACVAMILGSVLGRIS